MSDQVGTLVYFAATKEQPEYFKGRIEMLQCDSEIVLVPNAKHKESSPDYKIKANVNGAWYAFGSAWMKNADRAGNFLSLVFQNPALGNERIQVAGFYLDSEDQPDPKKPDHLRLIWSPYVAKVRPAAVPGGQPVIDDVIPF